MIEHCKVCDSILDGDGKESATGGLICYTCYSDEQRKALATENAALKAELAAQREEKLMWYGKCANLAEDVLATESDLYHAHGMHRNLAFDYLAMEKELALYKEAISVLRKWEQDTAIRLECCGCEYLEKMKECPVYDNPDCPPNAGTDEAVIQAALTEARAQLTRESLDAQCADTGHTEVAIQAVKEAGHD